MSDVAPEKANVPTKDPTARVTGRVAAPQAPLFGRGSVLNLVMDSDTGEVQGSNATREQSAREVLRPPVNIPEVLKLKDVSPHHAACITTKKNCMVGLGFMSDDDINGDGETSEQEQQVAKIASLLTGAPYIKSNVDTVLDPLTMFGFANELADWTEDFLDTGSAYLEVGRKGDKINYIGALPARDVRICKQGHNIYFQIQERSGTTKWFSRFGMENKKWLFSKEGPYANSTTVSEDNVSEIIYLSEPTNRCRYYGYPSWLAAAVDIDLLKKAKQYKADFYHNRGVLDFVFSVLGTKVDDKDWQVIMDNITGTAGEGSNFKNMGLNIPSENAAVQVDKLAGDAKTEDQFSNDNEVFSQNIVSAHGVPPLLANILIPGKLGASNEFVNSIIGFQLLRVGPAQQIIQKTLASTLGNSALNGGLELSENDFRLRTITSQLNLQALDTVGKMREEATTADRDLEDGVKD